MTINKLIDIFKKQRKDDVLNEERATEYVNALELRVINEIFQQHHGMPPRARNFRGYSDEYSFDDYLDTPLLVPPPYDIMYIHYIQYMMDMAEHQTFNMDNALKLFTASFNEFAVYWKKDHVPVQRTRYKDYY